MQTTTTVKKWGNSLAIRIPRAIVQNLGLSEDNDLQIISNGKVATLERKSHKKITLQQLLEKVTPENVHGEIDWGGPVGKEIW
jgi:antitoxin MazE